MDNTKSDAINLLAFDIGASNGRCILGTLQNNKLELEEIIRFPNIPATINNHLYWDVLRLFNEIRNGIITVSKRDNCPVQSLGIDTWGVDFGLLDKNGDLLGNPFHYRDAHTNGIMEKVFDIIPEAELYQITGIQFLQFNTIYQLYALKSTGSPVIERAATLLLMPDLLNYFLTGVIKTEITNAGTTQLLDVQKRQWSDDLINRLGLNRGLLTDIIPSGTRLGTIHKNLFTGSGIDKLPVIATAGHDTQSAISAVPAENDDFIYISSGTWSCMGVELNSALLTPVSRENAFANEQGTDNKITFLKNIMGLWPVQECRREWEIQGQKSDYTHLTEMAARAEPFFAFVDPDHSSFLSPGNMPEKIQNYCRDTGQRIPGSKAQIIRCILEGLALKYRFTVDQIEKLLHKKIPVIHIVGGGIRNKLLCQFTANATQKVTITGPAEATAAGNLMIQGITLGVIRDIRHGRAIIRNSFGTDRYRPQDNAIWEKAFNKFKEITGL